VATITAQTYSAAMRPLPIANPRNPWRAAELEYLEEAPDAGLKLYDDASKSIVSENDSPDLGFRWSVNPYRGCVHACAYCYARPSHEYLGFGAGTDFDRRIVLKREAASLLRAAFEKPSWAGELIVFSGVTDCYQPLEATYGLTRACLEVCRDYRNPVGIVTKSPLIERDLPLLLELAAVTSLQVSISVPFFDEDNARAVEPYVATPARRFRTIERLAAAGIFVGVNIAPVIPGLSDEDVPRILKSAHDAGARRAHMGLLRLPGSVKDVFSERIRAAFPLRAEKILARVRDTRGGSMNDARFGTRHDGTGEHADMLHQLFRAHLGRLGMNVWEPMSDPTPSTFRRPTDAGGQLRLFDAPER
jgi:DNA repair photolyase